MLVVSRFNEDVSWTKEFESVQIYNKGEDDLYLPSISLPNIGREAHTYLHHIIENYNNLDDVMIFSQGDYRHHFPCNIDTFKEILDLKYGFSLSSARPRLFHGFDVSNREDFSFRNCTCDHGNEYSLKEWWELTTGEEYVVSESVFYNSIFSLSREFILRRSLDSYIKIYKTLCSLNNPIEGHFCERSWFNIFNLPYISTIVPLSSSKIFL